MSCSFHITHSHLAHCWYENIDSCWIMWECTCTKVLFLTGGMKTRAYNLTEKNLESSFWTSVRICLCSVLVHSRKSSSKNSRGCPRIEGSSSPVWSDDCGQVYFLWDLLWPSCFNLSCLLLSVQGHYYWPPLPFSTMLVSRFDHRGPSWCHCCRL